MNRPSSSVRVPAAALTAALALTLAAPAALACGGLFCNSNQPVNQAGG